MIQKIKWIFPAVFSIALATGCNIGHKQPVATDLAPLEFSAKLNEAPGQQLLDVRTPEEFEKGHLAHAKNVDWNGSDFESGIAGLDKSKPVFVYCLSGGRSAAAAAKMRADGFTQVYELRGGIMAWRNADLPEVTDAVVQTKGMSVAQFQAMLISDKMVLVDFYADWCAPCKKMKPFLEEISGEKAATMQLLRINADENPDLCKALHIDGLPVLHLYKNQKLVWEHLGFIEKAGILEQLQ